MQRQYISSQLLFKIWNLIVFGVLLIFFFLLPQSRINSNLFDLLPNQNAAQYNNALLDEYLKTLDNQLVWLISDPVEGEKAAEFWSQKLSLIPEIATIEGKKADGAFSSYGAFLLKHPSLLPDPIIEKIRSGEQLKWIMSQLYSPFSGITIAEIKADPLLSTRSYVLEQLKQVGQFSMENGWITITDGEGTKWFLIRGELDPTASGMLKRQKIVKDLALIKEALQINFPYQQLLQKGSLFYSDYAAKTAEQDITTIGLLSLVGVIFLFYLFNVFFGEQGR